MAKLNEDSIEYVQPVFLNKLVELEGNHTKAAALIGISPAAISAVLAGKSQWRKIFELAAEFIYKRRTGSDKKTGIAIVTLDGPNMAALEQMVKSMGGTFTPLNQN